MPAFRGQPTQQQINDVSAYVAHRVGPRQVLTEIGDLRAELAA